MTIHVWDAIVVGGGYAGGAAALVMARRGLRVLVLETAADPSDAATPHMFFPDTTVRLAQLDLLDAIEASGAPPLTRLRLAAPDEDVSVTGHFRPVLGVGVGYALPRSTLVAILLRAAAAAGAEVRANTEVTDLLWHEGQVGGVVAVERRSASAGLQYKEPARVVVGADGRRSRIARWVRAQSYAAVQATTPLFAATFRGVDGPDDRIDVFHTGRRDYLLATGPDGVTGVLVTLPREELGRYRMDHEQNFARDIAAVPELAARFRHAERTGPIRGFTDIACFLRPPAGPGWALAGDAGASVHPISPRGVGLAVQDGEALAHALVEALNGWTDPAEALAEHLRLRDLAARPAYDQALAVAAVTGKPLPDPVIGLWRRLAANQTAADWWVSRQLEPRSPEAAERALAGARALPDPN